MKVGAVILCRYNSTRLPGKILKQVKGRSILENIIRRLETVDNLDKIIVATSAKETDDAIANYCSEQNITCYRGDLSNVAHRFLSASEHHQLDYAIRINGDNIFVDTETLSEMINTAVEKELDVVSNVPGRTFPYGTSIEIMKVNFYSETYKKFSNEGHFEHVTKYIYDNEVRDSFHFVKNYKYPQLSHQQMAVDTQEDLDRAIFIADTLKEFPIEYNLQQISQAIDKYKATTI